MSAKILDGKLLAAKLKEQLTAQVSALKHRTGEHLRLVSIIVGDDPGSKSYGLSQQRTAESLGIHYELQQLKQDVSQAHVLSLIEQLNGYKYVHGIIINKPLPSQLDFKTLADAIAPQKDVEGMALINLGKLFLGKTNIIPCTAAAAIELLKSAGVPLRGKQAVVIGRSEIVGKPAALLLLKEDVTVNVCHSKTVDIKAQVHQADIVIAAVGQKRFVQGDWLKKGSIVIDVGINDDEGKIVGDVDFESCSKVAGFISPVPGGVGPVTSVMLMSNAVHAFKNQFNIED